MWCRDCQQDVPAVAQTARGVLLCSRCQRVLEDAPASTPTDSGIELSSLDADGQREPTNGSPNHILEQEAARLRRIGYQLRGPQRGGVDVGLSPLLSRDLSRSLAPPSFGAEERLRSLTRRRARERRGPNSTTASSWTISLLLWCGVTGFFGGVALLSWSVAFQLPLPWQWGLTTTIAAEGLLILGLTWMALRLWWNGRRVNQQLDGVTGQIHELERLTGSLAGSRMSSSQHYYEHFNQAASPHVLLANLRGQVDQLASQLAS